MFLRALRPLCGHARACMLPQKNFTRVSGIRFNHDDPTVSHAEEMELNEEKEELRASKSGPPKGGKPVEVKAFYLARGIDIMRVFNNPDLYGKCPQNFDSKSLTITLNEAANEYVTVFNYGSVVMFNVPAAKQNEHLDNIKKNAITTPLGASAMITDEYTLMIHPELEGLPSVVKAAHLNIKQLDSNNITIVATVMSQTVSLDYYADNVDRMLESFMMMNLKVEMTGGNAINALDKQKLYRLVASNNTVITNVLSKLGIFEGSDAAWENADYHYTWEALRTEFELDYRFKDLSLKLDLVKDNSRFFLDILNAEKGEKLEWVIIILISVEIVLGLTELYLNQHAKATEKDDQFRLWDMMEQERMLHRRPGMASATNAPSKE